MLKDILPEKVFNGVSEIDQNLLNEIRLRNNRPIVVNVSGKNFYLNEYGVSTNPQDALKCDGGFINEIIRKVSNNSLYSINDQLINGYISYDGGIRIGIAGEIVSEHNEISTVKNINSLNIRIPHIVKNCSLNCYPLIVQNGQVNSTLIISSPGAGKTTFLRDLTMQISKRNLSVNILVADERGEISGGNNLILGDNVDVYLNSTKQYAFENGIRSLKPDVIVTDEINLENDLEVIENALTCGVKVIATIHAKNIFDLKLKKNFSNILNNQMFTRFIVLNSNCGPGTVEGIYNQNLNCIYCWMKIFLILVICISIFYLGVCFSKYYKKKLIFFNNLLNFCEILESQIQFKKITINQIIVENLNSFDFEFKQFLNEYYLKNNYNYSCMFLNSNENLIVKKFFKSLGKFDVKGEINNLKNQQNLLKIKQAEINDKNNKIGVLGTKLGSLCAILVFIILI